MLIRETTFTFLVQLKIDHQDHHAVGLHPSKNEGSHNKKASPY